MTVLNKLTSQLTKEKENSANPQFRSHMEYVIQIIIEDFIEQERKQTVDFAWKYGGDEIAYDDLKRLFNKMYYGR